MKLQLEILQMYRKKFSISPFLLVKKYTKMSQSYIIGFTSVNYITLLTIRETSEKLKQKSFLTLSMKCAYERSNPEYHIC
jgi:hypothetical protein